MLALSPLAYLSSIALIKKYDPSTAVAFEIGRTEAIAVAVRHAASLGLNVNNWTSGVQVDEDNDRYFYYRLRRSAEVEQARRVAPEAGVRVLFISPDGKERVQLTLGNDGRLLSFSRNLSPNQEIPDPGEEASRALARTAFRPLTGTDAASIGEPELSEERKFKRVTRRYLWKEKFGGLPELELRTSITVVGENVLGREVTSKFDEAYADKNFLNRQLFQRLAVVPFFFFIVFMAIYGLFRYIQLARQKEVSHARSLLVCIVMASAFLIIALQSDFTVFSTAPGNEQVIVMLFIIIFTGAVFLLLGLFLGVAYGSGEGDVREDYPGKLTSLDTLLTGRIFSRNVARAICIGAALGGWSLLARALVMLSQASRPDGGIGLSERAFGLVFGSLNWLMPLLTPFLTILTAVIGLLLPLSFLHHRFRSRRLSIGLLILMSLVSNLLVFQEPPVTFLSGLLSALISTVTLLISFFAFDLLTSIITISAPGITLSILYLVSQPAPSLQRAGFIAGVITLATLLVAVFFWNRGREYLEEQVRPKYARYLAERLGLQAEVSAAREAQARLMPQELPALSGLNLAAACLPAREVGGDFYDLFVFDKTKLGIFVAEGGGGGLGAALTIAYAKGFLMPRIDAGYSPTELICSLQAQLAPLLEQDEELALAVAVLDITQGTLVYARTGDYPQILTSRGDGGSHARNRLRVHTEEEEHKISLSPASDTNCVIREATISLADGDAIVFITDGVVRSLQDSRKTSLEDWALGVVTGRDGKAARSLQQSLVQALGKRAKQIKKSGVEDDLTAVVVRVETSGAA